MSGIEPANVAQKVDEYVDGELRDAAKYDNREPLDVSGVWSLHRMVAEVYALGYRDGERVAAERDRRARQRERTA